MEQDRRNNESVEDIPRGDGTVSDEDVKKVTGDDNAGVEGGQDHSTEERENEQPTEGVGAQPDQNDRQTNVAHTGD